MSFSSMKKSSTDLLVPFLAVNTKSAQACMQYEICHIHSYKFFLTLNLRTTMH